MPSRKENYVNREIEKFKNWEKGNIEKVRLKAGRQFDLVTGGGGGGPDPDPVDPDYVPEYPPEVIEATLAVKAYPEYAKGYLSLIGFVYRHLRTRPKWTIDLVYELMRRTRVAGAGRARSMLINGSRHPDERYIADALPWVTNRNNKIDFEQPNEYYFQCLDLIDRAAAYWLLIHHPTLKCDRYNYDIFNWRNNVQEVNGYRSDDGIRILNEFAVDVVNKQFVRFGPRVYVESENEAIHHDHWHGKKIAEHHLLTYRAVQHIVKNENFWVNSDNTHSSFTHAHLVGPHEFKMPDGSIVIFGSDEFKDREVKVDCHGVHDLQSLYNAGFDSILYSAWRHGGFNEDGCQEGDYIAVPGVPQIRLGSYTQVNDLCVHAIEECYARGKTFYWTGFAKDCLRIDPEDGVIKETYPLDEMGWARDRAYSDAREEVDGG